MRRYYEPLTFLIRSSRGLSPVGVLGSLRWMGGNQAEDSGSVINASGEPTSRRGAGRPRRGLPALDLV